MRKSRRRERPPRRRTRETVEPDPDRIRLGGRIVVRRDDGRIGFYDDFGVWHTGLPVPTWGEFIASLGLDPRSTRAALAVLGVQADWSCSRTYGGARGTFAANRVPHEPVIYYASCPGGLIKIGTTRHLYSRWLTYRNVHKSAPEFIPDGLLAVERGTDDKAVIRRFQHLRINPRSEYLEPAPELAAWIAQRGTVTP